MLTIGLLAYLVVGLLVMDYMCPLWHPLEKLVGAVIWPIAVVIGIRMLWKERTADARLDADFQILCLAVVIAHLELQKTAERRSSEER